jgi:ParB-like chromosome segregation protein Spo0J
MDLATLSQPTSEAAQRIVAEAEAKKAGRSSSQGGIKDLSLGRTDTYEISPFDIRVKPDWNGRDWSLPENQEHVANLAASIEKRGVEEPMTVYWEDGAPYLMDGESRLRAVLHLINERGVYIPRVPVRTDRNRATDEERVAGMLVKNTGKGFNTLEKAGVVRRLLSAGKSLEWIEEETGLTTTRLKQLLEVDALPEPVREQVAHGTVSATEAVRVVREHGDDAPAVIEQAAALSGENGAKAGRATRATLEAVTNAAGAPQTHDADAANPPVAPLSFAGLLRVLESATAIEEAGEVAVYVSMEDWERITALF